MHLQFGTNELRAPNLLSELQLCRRLNTGRQNRLRLGECHAHTEDAAGATAVRVIHHLPVGEGHVLHVQQQRGPLISLIDQSTSGRSKPCHIQCCSINEGPIFTSLPDKATA